MTPQQYERLTELFHAALEIAPDERAAFLDQVSDGDADLRRELESLLAAHEQRAAYTEKPPDDIAAGCTWPSRIAALPVPPHLLPILESTAMRFARCSAKVAWAKFIWRKTCGCIAKSR